MQIGMRNLINVLKQSIFKLRNIGQPLKTFEIRYFTIVFASILPVFLQFFLVFFHCYVKVSQISRKILFSRNLRKVLLAKKGQRDS